MFRGTVSTPKLGKASWFAASILAIVLLGLLPSGDIRIPVEDANSKDWHQDTFWYEPWGKSGVHKGIDIFAARSTPIISPAPGLVLFTGEIERGGKIVVMLGARWRLHYFAHLEHIDSHAGAMLPAGVPIGSVGDSGNAAGKQPHLHYSIISLLPHPWRGDGSTQGWKKMFFLNPVDYMR